MDFDEIIRRAIAEAEDDIVPSILAHQLVLQHPTDSSAWVLERKQAVVTDAIASRLGAQRRRFTTQARFSQAVQSATDGISILDVWYEVDEHHTRRRFRDMTANDLIWAAMQYERSANTAMFEAAYLRVIAKRVGHRTVGEVMDEAALAQIRRTVTAPAQTA